MKRVVAAWAVVLVLLVALAAVHQLRAGSQAMEESDAAAAAGDRPLAIARARAAAEARLPGSPYPARAYARLAAIARDAEAHGDERTAQTAWAAMRAAAIETRAPGDGTDAWRAMADEGIARVGARSFGGPEARSTSEVRPAQAALATALARSDVPNPATFALLAAGAVAFFAGVARLLFVAGMAKAVDRAGALRQSRLAAAAVVAGGVAYALAYARG